MERSEEDEPQNVYMRKYDNDKDYVCLLWTPLGQVTMSRLETHFRGTIAYMYLICFFGTPECVLIIELFQSVLFPCLNYFFIKNPNYTN